MIDVLNWIVADYGHTFIALMLLLCFRPVRVVINAKDKDDD